MKLNNPNNYVLVLEDCSQTQYGNEIGKLSVVSSIDKNVKINTVEFLVSNNTAFIKFKKDDNIMSNFFFNLVLT